MFSIGKSVVGLDIDDRSIEVAHIKKQGDSIKILSLGRMILEQGIVDNGKIKQMAPLISAIKEVMAKARPVGIKNNNIVLGLPVNQVYSVLVKIPTAIANKDIAIRAEAKRNIPLEDDDLFITYKSLQKTADGEEILITGASKEVVAQWQEVAKRLKINDSNLDIELYALFRDLDIKDKNQPACLVDIGATTTNIVIFHDNDIQYTCSLKFAGDRFTQAVADKYKIDFNIAEVKKIRLGLNRQLFPVIENELAEIADEIKRVLDYYRNKSGKTISEVLLVGGSSKLKGLVHYLEDKLGLPVRFGKAVSVSGDYPEYVGAIGFALRKIFPERWQDEPIIKYEKTNNSWLTKQEPEVIKSNTIMSKKMINPNDDFGPIVSRRNQERGQSSEDKKIAFEKKALILILIFGLILVGGSFWYREQGKRQKKQQELANEAENSLNNQAINFRVGLVLSGDSGIKARVVEDKIETANDYSEAESLSRRNIEGKLAQGESVWKDPLNEILDKKTFKAPITFRWLVYSDKDILQQLFADIDKKNSDGIQYSFSSWTKDKLEKTDSADKLYLSGVLNLASTKVLPVDSLGEIIPMMVTSSTSTISTTTAENTAQTNSTSMPDASQTGSKTGTVKQTETGWLNVRQGPSATDKLITKINPGEVYDILEEQTQWVKIKLKDGNSGWVAIKYLEIK